MIERESDGLRDNPDREAKARMDELVEVGHKRASFQDMAQRDSSTSTSCVPSS
jgi:hypothetical protein